MFAMAGKMTFDPSIHDEVVAVLDTLNTTSPGEAGCVSYSFTVDLHDPNTFRFFECWESEELLDAHLAEPHEVAFGERNLGRITGATASMFVASPADGNEKSVAG